PDPDRWTLPGQVDDLILVFGDEVGTVARLQLVRDVEDRVAPAQRQVTALARGYRAAEIAGCVRRSIDGQRIELNHAVLSGIDVDVLPAGDVHRAEYPGRWKRGEDGGCAPRVRHGLHAVSHPRVRSRRVDHSADVVGRKPSHAAAAGREVPRHFVVVPVGAEAHETDRRPARGGRDQTCGGGIVVRLEEYAGERRANGADGARDIRAADAPPLGDDPLLRDQRI